MKTFNKYTFTLFALLILALAFYGCSSESKPSQEELSTGLYELFIEEEPFASLGDENVRNYAECLADGVYEEISATQLNALVDTDSIEVIGDEEIFDEEADQIFTDASEACRDQIDLKLLPQTNSNFTQ